MKKAISDERMHAEIEFLSKDEDVMLARAEFNAQQRKRDKERQKLYQLRWLKKRGAALRAQGYTVEDYENDCDIFLPEEETDGCGEE